MMIALGAAVGLVACQSDDDDMATPDNSINIHSSPVMQATFDGAEITIREGEGYLITHSAHYVNNVPPATSSAEYFSHFVRDPGMEQRFTVGIGTLHYTSDTQPTAAEFLAFFSNGDRPYTAGAVNGVRIEWVDDNGKEWATDFGSADQTGSSFNIAQTQDISDTNGPRMKVRANFHCKLYDGAGGTMDVNSGVVVTHFGLD